MRKSNIDKQPSSHSPNGRGVRQVRYTDLRPDALRHVTGGVHYSTNYQNAFWDGTTVK